MVSGHFSVAVGVGLKVGVDVGAAGVLVGEIAIVGEAAGGSVGVLWGEPAHPAKKINERLTAAIPDRGIRKEDFFFMLLAIRLEPIRFRVLYPSPDPAEEACA